MNPHALVPTRSMGTTHLVDGKLFLIVTVVAG